MKTSSNSAPAATRRAANSSKLTAASTRSSSKSAPARLAVLGAQKSRALKTSSQACAVATSKSGAARARKVQDAAGNKSAEKKVFSETVKDARHPASNLVLPARSEKTSGAKARAAKTAALQNEKVSPVAAKKSAASKVVARALQTQPVAQKSAGKKTRDAMLRQGAKSLACAASDTIRKALPETKPEVATIKAKRARLPADFAAQYARETKTKAPPAPTSVPKKRARRSAAERENLRRALMPDDDFLQRLARAGAIPSSAEVPALRRQSAPRRSRKWESRCGKCGTNSTFSTPASLCARCGTIVVRAE